MTKAVSEAEVKKAEAAMIKARSKLLMDQPFFGALALKLKLVPVLDPAVVDTAAVDGRNMFYHPPFVNGLQKAALEGLVAHEVMHCVFNHMSRRAHRDNQTWNIACDYTINSHLLDNGFVLPDGGIIDTDKKYVGWNAEAIYSDLTKNGEPPPPPTWGLVMDCTDPSAQQVEWDIAVRAAATTAKQAGKMPGNIAGLIEELLEPVVDWRSILWQFASSLDRSEFNWGRPNRAYISEDLYLPSLRNETLGPLVIAIDTSGSVDQECLKQFWAEIVDIARHQRPEKLVVIQCDSKVHHVEDIDIETAGNESFKIHGRGGTDFAPAVNYAREHFPDAEALIYLTDMECHNYGDPPDYPVIWMSTEKQWADPPFGEVYYMSKDT
jgi:predicted metal-dependent peptidase